MKKSSEVLTDVDIRKVVYDILKQSKSFDVFPTPVDAILRYAELHVDQHSSMHSIPNHYISKNIRLLESALKKVFGALDRRKKVIYLNPALLPVKRRFVQLHEVGHHSLPWQRKIFEHVEDESTLDPCVAEEFEGEANFFASAALFQLDRFEEMAASLPLSIKTARVLATKFGGSIHAALRRYVQTVNRRCALLVLNGRSDSVSTTLILRDYFPSHRFIREFGNIILPNEFGIEWPFVEDYFSRRRAIDNPEPLSLAFGTAVDDFEYQYFSNGYNIFILLTPIGEKVKSRTTIIMSS